MGNLRKRVTTMLLDELEWKEDTFMSSKQARYGYWFIYFSRNLYHIWDMRYNTRVETREWTNLEPLEAQAVFYALQEEAQEKEKHDAVSTTN
jgi:hypothetical protein